MKIQLALLSLVVLFVSLPSVVFASPVTRLEPSWWADPVNVVFVLGLGLLIVLIYIALLLTRKK